ncbi:tRNA-uridine aminocarboxypropyltransferase 1 [Bombina bombina]|uniref:tRNA-uridine aminocarboxypropyltransferase 1 n=1 Tax=Bombina bombina TaxID=8345 RepID=UPI00235A8319|nr:tRNA-uridine aminocarboxypropyltransferase 1 [Bombina bombina]
MSSEKQRIGLQEKNNSEESNILENLQLSSQEVLESAQKKGRAKCPKCHCSRMFYCYTCYTPVGTVSADAIPQVKLPFKIDIIKHPNETDGKSTAAHAKLLAQGDVTVYTYPCIPEYEGHMHEVVLVFPGPSSVALEDSLLSLSQLFSQNQDVTYKPSSKRLKGNSETDENEMKIHCIKRVIFIDSTWNQTNKIVTDERLQGLVKVELTDRKTCFWRHQKGSPDTYLSTIEAIYYFAIDYHTQILKEDYNGEYDNLLFFYSFMHRLIKNAKHSAGKL